MAQSQPAYRRPSWARADRSYNIYMRKDLAEDRSPLQDYDVDNFSYDDAHLARWQSPPDLIHHLPEALRQEVENWTYAGAAVCTALERIANLHDEGIHRGWPDKSSMGHLSRTDSHTSPAVMPTNCVGSPPTNLPGLSDSALPESHVLHEQQKSAFKKPTVSVNTSSRAVVPPVGMESPPFTPVNSQTCASPVNPVEGLHATLPDLTKITTQFTSVQSPGTLSPATTSGATSPIIAPASTPISLFDENAWETYINCFHAELQDVRTLALPRLRGFSRTIDKLRHEYGGVSEWHDAMIPFGIWWDSMKPKAKEYEERVKNLSDPNLEEITRERIAHGLPL